MVTGDSEVLWLAWLRGQGYEVDEAADGAQGRELGATGALGLLVALFVLLFMRH